MVRRPGRNPSPAICLSLGEKKFPSQRNLLNCVIFDFWVFEAKRVFRSVEECNLIFFAILCCPSMKHISPQWTKENPFCFVQKTVLNTWVDPGNRYAPSPWECSFLILCSSLVETLDNHSVMKILSEIAQLQAQSEGVSFPQSNRWSDRQESPLRPK